MKSGSRGVGLGWVGLGWVGLGLSLRQRQCLGLTSPARLGPCLRLSGLTAAQTADRPRTSPRRWREGDTAVPVCVGRAYPGPGGGGQGTGSGTVANLCSAPVGCGPPVGGWGGLCVPCASGPSSRAWVPYHKAAGGVWGLGDLRLPPAHS